MDNLKRRGKIVVNACPMCLKDEEIVDHLLLRCKIAMKIWNTFLTWLGCSWVPPNQIQDLFTALKSPIGSHKGKEMWKLTFLAVIWCIWKERNARRFEGTAANGESICGKIKFSVVQWVLIYPILKDISVDQILYNWKEVAMLKLCLGVLYSLWSLFSGDPMLLFSFQYKSIVPFALMKSTIQKRKKKEKKNTLDLDIVGYFLVFQDTRFPPTMVQ